MMHRELPGPPRVAEWLVEHLLPSAAREAVLGDLHERFATRYERGGAARATLWYWKQVFGFVIRAPFLLVGRPAERRARGRIRSRVARTADAMMADARFAVRALRRRASASVSAIAILTLSVSGVATVAAVFCGVLMRPLPFPESDRLVMLWEAPVTSGPLPLTQRQVEDWSARTDVFESVGAFESVGVAIAQGDYPERVEAALVSWNLLSMLGARAELGRLFSPDDDATSAEPVVVLGHTYWTTRLGADRSIIGRTIRIDGVATRVIGVVADDFWFYDPYASTRSVLGRGAESARLWQPLRASTAIAGETDYPRYRVIARLADGVGVEAARLAAAQIRDRLPSSTARPPAELRLVPVEEQITADVRPRLFGLAGAVLLVFVIACVNLTNLLLEQAESRRGEAAIRMALGANRLRLARETVIEAFVLALAGAAGGLLLAMPATAWLLTMMPRGVPLAHRVAIDGLVVAIGVGAAVAGGVVAGGVAALRIARTAAVSGTPSRTITATRGLRRTQSMLVGAQVALSLVLLVAATTLVRSLVGVLSTDPGFTAHGVLTFQVAPGPTPGSAGFFDELESRLRRLPGVSAVGSASAVPFSRWAARARVSLPGGAGEPTAVDYRSVSPDLFDALDMTLRAGRRFAHTDRAGAPRVAVVNESFALQWFGGARDALGRSITIDRREPVEHTIIGVVADVRERELHDASEPTVYTSVAQTATVFRWFAVRTTPGSEFGLVDAVRRVAREIEPTRPLQNFITLEQLVAQSLEEERFYSELAAAFAAFAFLLSIVGIAAVVSYATRQRHREIGIRMALGARRHRVYALILAQGMRPVWIGLMFGISGAYATTGTLRGLIHDVPERDPLGFAAVAAAFALVAATACLAPARRAARLEPTQTLRSE